MSDAQDDLEPVEAAPPLIDDTHAQQMFRVRLLIDTCSEEWQILKEDAAGAKKQLDAAHEELRELVEQAERGFGPLFNQKTDEQPQVAASSGEWRQVTIALLPNAASGATLQRLAEKDILTIGDLADWTKEHGDFWYKDIPGLGKVKADKLSDALEEFWATHPQPDDDEPVAWGVATPDEAADGEEG